MYFNELLESQFGIFYSQEIQKLCYYMYYDYGMHLLYFKDQTLKTIVLNLYKMKNFFFIYLYLKFSSISIFLDSLGN